MARTLLSRLKALQLLAGSRHGQGGMITFVQPTTTGAKFSPKNVVTV